MMRDVLVEIAFLFILRIILLGLWLVSCFGIMAVPATIQWISKKKLIRGLIKIPVATTACIMILMLVDDLGYIIKHRSMWLGIWLALCFVVTAVTVVAQLINKKLRKKKPIHWAKKIAGYAAFYTISLFAIMKLLGSYPGNWLAIDMEYRELAYELYNLKLDCHVYKYIREGSYGEIEISFIEDSYGSAQRDYIMIKTAVEEYIKENRNFQGKRIDIDFECRSGQSECNIYNFDPWTGEMGTDAPCWFADDIWANNCSELAEFYHDFSGINAVVGTMDGIQDLAELCNLTYLQLNSRLTAQEEKYYFDELNALLPDCEIHLNQYDSIYPAWEKFSD